MLRPRENGLCYSCRSLRIPGDALLIGERPRDVREVDGTSAERDRVVGVSSIPGRHPGLWSRLWNNTGQARESARPARRGGAEA